MAFDDSRVPPLPAAEKNSPSYHRKSRVWESTKILEDIKRFAKRHLDDTRGSHAWDHTLRVFHLSCNIGQKEGADMTVLPAAALLHDIGRRHEDEARGQVCHAGKGAELAAPFLDRLPLSGARKKNILHCIRAHRFRGDLRPATLEAKVLFDADKIDAIGAVGVARAYLFAGEVGARLHNADINIEETAPYTENDTGYREYKVKLAKIRDRILTAEGKRIAARRHEFMELFFKQFLEEVEGIR